MTSFGMYMSVGRNDESANYSQRFNVKKQLKTVCFLFGSGHEARGGLSIPQWTQQRLPQSLGKKLFLYTSVLPSSTLKQVIVVFDGPWSDRPLVPVRVV